MEVTAIRAYEILKRHNFSEEEAETIIASKDESLSKWVAGKEDVSAVREEMAAVRSELKEEITAVRSDMAKMEGRLETSFAKAQSTMIKRFIGTSIALAGSVFAIVRLVA